jgi:hypothetical protein
MEGVLIVLHPSPPIPSFRASSHTLTHPFPLSHFPNSTLTFLNFFPLLPLQTPPLPHFLPRFLPFTFHPLPAPPHAHPLAPLS